MINHRKFISILLAISMLLSLALSANASSLTSPTDADINYFPGGSYIYQVGNKYYFFDAETSEVLVLAEKYYPSVSVYACYHVPANLLPYWNWYQTDGPYEVSVRMAAVHRIIQAGGSYLDVATELGLTVAVIQYMIEAADGNITSTETVWEVDDGYTYFDDVTYFRIESYYYSDSICRTLVDTNSYTYHG